MIRNRVFETLRERNEDKRGGKLGKEGVNISDDEQLDLLGLDLSLLYLVKFLKGFDTCKVALVVAVIIKRSDNSRRWLIVVRILRFLKQNDNSLAFIKVLFTLSLSVHLQQ